MSPNTRNDDAPPNGTELQKSSMWIPFLWIGIPLAAVLIAAYLANGG